jgi:uncharacterized membrane protein
VAFVISGMLHFVRPAQFERIMPRVLPEDTWRPLIALSGAAELACAAGLAARARWARPVSVALLLAVFPANVQMALDAGSGRNPPVADSHLVAWGRLPLQALLIRAVLQRDGAAPAEPQ